MDNIIIYFSGTGNSYLAALGLSEKLDATCYYLPSITKDTLLKCKSIVLVTPVYSFGLPPITREFVEQNAKLMSGKKINLVLTFGGITANTANAAALLLSSQGLFLQNVYKVRMPMNFTIAIRFPKFLENSIIKSSKKKINKIAMQIQKNKTKKQRKNIFAFLDKTNLKNLAKLKLTAKEKFIVTSNCTKCGHCIKLCPTKNIEFENKQICFKDNCTSCFACFHRCPEKAINYGTKTIAKDRYINPCVDVDKMK